jgi:hypothetical protein
MQLEQARQAQTFQQQILLPPRGCPAADSAAATVAAGYDAATCRSSRDGMYCLLLACTVGQPGAAGNVPAADESVSASSASASAAAVSALANVAAAAAGGTAGARDAGADDLHAAEHTACTAVLR